MRELKELRAFCEQHSEAPVILCTIVQKRGSNYRGVGAQKAVALPGGSAGVLSGGCLEGSIEKFARENFQKLPCLESFSTMTDEDRLMGYQTGCQGEIEILFEQVRAGDLNLQIPFGRPQRFSAVQVSLDAKTLARRQVVGEGSFGEFTCPQEHVNQIAKASASGTASGTASASEIASIKCYTQKWQEPIELVVFGGAQESAAYIEFANVMGWDIRVLEHRKSDPATLVAEVPCGNKTAIVLATHNYEVDLEILRHLRKLDVGYVGCMGPLARFERLQADLKALYNQSLSVDFVSKVSAPAGIFTRGKGGSEIALSIVAQIHEKLGDPVIDRANFGAEVAGQTEKSPYMQKEVTV